MGVLKRGAGTPLLLFSFCSLQSLKNLMFSEKVIHKKEDQESKNKEVIEGIPERHIHNFMLVRIILDSEVQVSTTWLEKIW